MAADPATRAPSTPGLRVLVVEDVGMLAVMLQGMLETMGHQVLGIASTVERALMLVETHAAQLDLVLLDVALNGQSALPVAERLAQGSIACVVASGHDARDLRRAGFSGSIITKPYDYLQIARAIAQARAQAGQGRPAGA